VPRVPTLCLGEALVDLVCERPAATLVEADSFVPHFGGAVANVAVTAARVGAAVALAGGAGDDEWGEWLRDRLRSEGVDLEWFALASDVATPLAFVVTDAAGEPHFEIHGDGIQALIVAAGERLDEAVEECDALFFSSNTLAGERERELTLGARERALALGRHVCFDPNLRLHRWGSVQTAVESARACLPGAFLVRANRTEAELLTRESDPESAARGLVAAGARIAVVTLGAEGALMRGEVEADEPGRAVALANTVGAGDALMGVLLGRLSLSGFYPPAAAAALPEAVDASARACERWGAL
jgi:sugar/nucleoside kinase (ribokinase family)